MNHWTRARYQINLPLDGERKITASREHLRLAREAGREGMVLLKNNNQVLPFRAGTKLALFGKGVFDYVKGGGGSGDVTVSHVYNLYDGLKQHAISTEVYEPLADFYRQDVAKQYAGGSVPGMLVEPECPAELMEGARAFTDTAVIVISRFSGEGWDRKGVFYDDQVPDEARMCAMSNAIFENSDFCLTEAEAKMVQTVSEKFVKVAVVLNMGGMMDTVWFANNDNIDSVLLAWQGGMEGGNSMADILLGVDSPSGKLPDTLTVSLDAYPSTAGFHESEKYVDYTEDIYVGYRYFETIPGAAEKVIYPFGFGLSYTQFAIEPLYAGEKDGNIIVSVQVRNVGEYAGKEVVQLYFSAPQGKLGKPEKELAAFAKTRRLNPGQAQVVTLSFPAASMASFDDLGKICKSAYVLEQGVYHFHVGNSVRDTVELDFAYGAAEDILVEQCVQRMKPSQLAKRMVSDGSYEMLPQSEPVNYMENAIGWEGFNPGYISPIVRAVPHQNIFCAPEKHQLDEVAEGSLSLDVFLAQLSIDDKIHLLGGQPNTGVANTWGFGNLPEYGVPSVMTADGPAGLRILPMCGIYTTAWPIASQLCATWNVDLIRSVGEAAAKEVRENNISVWLAPAVNIHRSPLCGRNFEYYSEDPVLAGRMAASLIDGVQSQGVAAEVKHFCCNNKETNRKNSDSRVSERALREIYLKQFEIIVKTAQPKALMTAYNLVNSQRCSENGELLNGILREEWGFEGIVTTDWWTYGEHYKEAKAGNDIKMAAGFPDRVKKAFEIGAITEEEITACARRVLELILKVDW